VLVEGPGDGARRDRQAVVLVVLAKKNHHVPVSVFELDTFELGRAWIYPIPGVGGKLQLAFTASELAVSVSGDWVAYGA